jgi:hypothetical protein
MHHSCQRGRKGERDRERCEDQQQDSTNLFIPVMICALRMYGIGSFGRRAIASSHNSSELFERRKGSEVNEPPVEG